MILLGRVPQTRTTFGARLEHPMLARIRLAGYASKELIGCWSPIIFRLTSQPISETFTGVVAADISGSIRQPWARAYFRRSGAPIQACGRLSQSLTETLRLRWKCGWAATRLCWNFPAAWTGNARWKSSSSAKLLCEPHTKKAGRLR